MKKIPTSNDMAMLAGKIMGWSHLILEKTCDVKFSHLVQDMQDESREIAEKYTDVEINKYYGDSGK